MKIKAVSGIMLTLLLISMLTLALNIQTVRAEPRTWYVNDDGGADFTSIQEAINAASPRDTIYVKEGMYNENVIVNKTVSLVGENRETTIIDSSGLGKNVMEMTVDNVTLTGFTLRNGGIYHSGVHLGYVNNCHVSGNNIANNHYGISLKTGSNNTVSGNNITANDWAGISIIGSSNNTVAQNDITANKIRNIYLDSSSDNTFSGNNITNSSHGIDIEDSYNNIIYRNNIKNNKMYGINLYHSNYNTIYGNNITNNGEDLGPGWNPAGIRVHFSYNNTIYHNNFIDNIAQVSIFFETNVWDDGYPSGGNYWDEYTGEDANGDRIGDTPYVIDANNQDRYPLMNPWTPPSVGANAGDWIKYDYTVTGWPSGTPYPEWLKVEILGVEGTTATVRVTMHMSDGTEPSQTMTVDVVAGGETFDTFSGFVIPANFKTGDSIYISGYGNVTIDGETTRTYAGASRTVVYASFSQYGTQLTYYWDKQTGIMVEASMTSGSMTGTAKATETNMWETTPPTFWMQWWFYAIVAVVIVALAGAVYFLKKRKPPTPTAPPPPTEGTLQNIPIITVAIAV